MKFRKDFDYTVECGIEECQDCNKVWYPMEVEQGTCPSCSGQLDHHLLKELPDLDQDYSYPYGTTPPEIITQACKKQCPKGYPMVIKDQTEWEIVSTAVNQGIDSHLEAITERSTFDSNSGSCLVHPEELQVLLRRLEENEKEEAMSLRTDILSTLDIIEE